jgi:hypothetical protein
MVNCSKHGARKATVHTSIGTFCKECAEQIMTAQAHVVRYNSHVTPGDCFAMYMSNREGWKFIEGTGCAHWVAHQLHVTGSSGDSCAKGFKFKVKQLTEGFRMIDRKTEAVRAGDSRQGGVVENYFPSFLKDGDFYRR